MKINKTTVAKHTAWFVLCCAAIALIFVVVRGMRQLAGFDKADAISIFISTLETVGLIVTVVIAVRQLNGSKEIARATFISELNKSYVENPEYVAIYNYLQDCLDGKCPHKGSCGSDKCYMGEPKPKGGGFLKSAISNYLTFFETIYILNIKGVLGIDVIDNLFAYRFFLAVHSRFFQEEKLLAQPRNFINIYLLEKEWLEYRKRKGKDKPDDDTIYTRRTLESELKKRDSEAYEEIFNSR